MAPSKISIEDVRHLLSLGWGIAQVAKKLGVTYQAVRFRVRQANIPYVPDSGRNRSPMPGLAELVAQGLKTGEIARKYNSDYKRVLKRIRKLKIPYDRGRPGALNPAWKGGRRKCGPYIYIWCPTHPHATQAGCVLESRLVMELKLGRYLLPTEVVHHKDGYENHPDNLVLYETNAAHLAETLKGKVPRWTPEGRRRILEAIRQPRGPRKKSNRGKSEKNASQ